MTGLCPLLRQWNGFQQFKRTLTLPFLTLMKTWQHFAALIIPELSGLVSQIKPGGTCNARAAAWCWANLPWMIGYVSWRGEMTVTVRSRPETMKQEPILVPGTRSEWFIEIFHTSGTLPEPGTIPYFWLAPVTRIESRWFFCGSLCKNS